MRNGRSGKLTWMGGGMAMLMLGMFALEGAEGSRWFRLRRKSEASRAQALRAKSAAKDGFVSKQTTVLGTNGLMQHVRVLASDDFEGRSPGSRGEEKTVAYLVDQFRGMGLEPGGAKGEWTQDVPIVGVKSSVSFKLDGEALTFPQDFVAWSPRLDSVVKLDESDLVFVGYGVTAPEYQWDDFKGVDVRGKTVVILVGDPPVPDPADASKLDEKMFKGRAMTYYGRWTYKYEEAARRGAAAAIIIHETKPASYPWFVVVNSWGRERFDLEGAQGPTVGVAGWMSLERAQKLLADSGTTYEAMKAAAIRKEFKPVTLKGRASFVATQTTRSVKSKNVVAKVSGRDPGLRNEYLVYTAHWDHLGKDEKLTGDQIFNGAADNAIGTAGLLELARAFRLAGAPPKRTVVFLAVTAEEQGLLGAKYYGENPLYPLDRTLANINMDGLNQWGRTREMAVVGEGSSTLVDVARAVATRQGRRIVPEPKPEQGMFYRSDHFEFARQGVPALYLKAGQDYRDFPEGFGARKVEEYVEKDYHKVSDEVKPAWDLRGAVEDLELLYEVGFEVGDGAEWPQWKVGSEFKARREAMLSPRAVGNEPGRR